MTGRGQQLHAIADGQIVELIDIVSALDEAALRLPCPGREKLGDGTVAASARHTADNYQRIAAFIETSDRMSSAHAPSQHTGHRVPRLLRALGHRPASHHEHGPAGQHGGLYTVDSIELDAVVEQLEPRESPSVASPSSPTAS